MSHGISRCGPDDVDLITVSLGVTRCPFEVRWIFDVFVKCDRDAYHDVESIMAHLCMAAEQ